MSTSDNTHELHSPQEIHEMGHSNTRRSRKGDEKKGEMIGLAELEGDVAWKDVKDGEREDHEGGGMGKGFVMIN